MGYEVRDNSGSLFKNERMVAENHANAQGKCMVGGEMYYISAWTKTDKNGNKWQSLSFKSFKDAGRAIDKAVKSPEKARLEEPKKNDDPGDFADFSDDIPF